MKILFLFQRFSFESSTIYLDLVDECAARGHDVYVLAGTSREVSGGQLYREHGCSVAYVRLPDQFHSGKIKKGLVQLMIEPLFLRSMKKLLWDKRIDIIAYPTPPITLAGVVSRAKTHYGAATYLMLKDIFPQNAADLGMMKQGGLLFKYFKAMERCLYRASDYIGCMSEANIAYMREHEPEVAGRLELFPNTVRLLPDEGVKASPDKNDAVSFVLGGNLGEPQGLEFLLEGIKSLDDEGYTRAKFMIIGDGTRAGYVDGAIKEWGLKNAAYKKQLSRDEYERLLAGCDVGLISLSGRFTIPNFPSRLLSYMQLAKPVLVVSDKVTDIGSVVTEAAKCGFYVPWGDIKAFTEMVKRICSNRHELPAMGLRGRGYLKENYNVGISVDILEKKILLI